jgi:transposase InsO family protein
VELATAITSQPEVFVSHRNAKLTPTGRQELAKLVVDEGWPLRRAADRCNVSVKTAKRWADRYRELGPGGMQDRSSRPRHSPNRTPVTLERKIVKIRVLKRLGPIRIASRLGMPASTVSAVLRRYRVPKLAHLDRATGRRIRRYEHPHPGDLIHVDIKKLGNIPDGGGHRAVGRAAGLRNRAATTTAGRSRNHDPKLGYGYLHTALDDHSRLAYTEVLPDETKQSAVTFWTRAQAFFTEHGITVHRVLTDNGSAYRSHLWRDTLHANGITHKRTRPYRPQTNGKVERFHRTLADEWAYTKIYNSEQARRDELPLFLHMYNHHRAHSSLGGRPPISRVTNLPAHYI